MHGIVGAFGSQDRCRLYFVAARILAADSEPVMIDSQQRAVYYRKLFARLDAIAARSLIDRLQVLALTYPDAVRELETFLDRDDARNLLGASAPSPPTQTQGSRS